MVRVLPDYEVEALKIDYAVLPPAFPSYLFRARPVFRFSRET